MWHCSVSKLGGAATLRDLARCGALLETVLLAAGEGDIMWETGALALHGRRYLTAQESYLVGGVVEVRGTAEHRMRAEAVRKHLPAGALEAMGEAP